MLITLGYGSEQSIEAYHKVCNPVIERYKSQRGELLSTKHFINHIMLLTSPIYQ